MKKYINKNLIYALIVFAMLFFSACTGGLKPEEYLEYELDASYKNINLDKLIDIYTNNITQEQLMQAHSENMRAYAVTFLSETCSVNTSLLNADTLDYGESIFTQIYANAKYSVNDSKKTQDGYMLSVTIYPIDIITKNITEEFYNNKIDEIYSQLEKDEVTLENEFANEMLKMLEQNLSDISYTSAVDIFVLLSEVDDYFQISEDSLIAINNNILIY